MSEVASSFHQSDSSIRESNYSTSDNDVFPEPTAAALVAELPLVNGQDELTTESVYVTAGEEDNKMPSSIESVPQTTSDTTPEQPSLEEPSSVAEHVAASLESTTESAAVSAPLQVSQVDEGIQRAVALKNEGTALFKQERFEEARAKYTSALESLQYGDASLSIEQKAALFELSIPLSNNAALCLYKEKNFTDCIVFAKNGLMFCNILESNGSHIADVWTYLQTEKKLTLRKLFDFKRKSLLCIGKAHYFKQNYVDCISQLEEALPLIAETDEKEIKDIQKWIVLAKKEEAKALKKEKAVWGKAFAKGSASTEEKSQGKKTSKADKKAGASADYSLLLGGLGVLSLLGAGAYWYLRRTRK